MFSISIQSRARRAVVLLLSPALPLLTACHDDVIPEPLPTSSPTPGPVPMARFVADAAGSGRGIRISLEEVQGRDSLLLALETTWGTQRLRSADLLVRIDPRARAAWSPVPGSWQCTSQASWYTTGNPGEWLVRAPVPGLIEGEDPDWRCTCPLSEEQEPASFEIARMHFTIQEPGSWRIDVSPASPTPVCDCSECLQPDLQLSGGTIHVAAP